MDIINCYSSGSVGGSNNVGGLVGLSKDNSTLSNCYSTASVSGANVIGGLIGYSYLTTIDNCYTSGNVTVPYLPTYCAAFIGEVLTSTISASYGIGNVYATYETDPGNRGFVAENTSFPGTYSNNFFDSEASNQSSATGATAKTTAEMKRAATFLDAGWSFVKSDAHWAMNGSDNSGYPFLRFEGYTPSQIWLGTGSTAWTLTGNWSEETAPASAENIIVPDVTNDLVISGTNASCNNMLLEPNAALEVVAMDGSLTVNGNLTNNGTFTIKSDATGTGSLIVNGTATGNVTMQRYIAAATWTEWDDGWHFLSSHLVLCLLQFARGRLPDTRQLYRYTCR